MLKKNYVYEAVKKIEIKQAELVFNVEYLPQLDDMDRNTEGFATFVGITMFTVMVVFLIGKRVRNVRKEQRTI